MGGTIDGGFEIPQKQPVKVSGNFVAAAITLILYIGSTVYVFQFTEKTTTLVVALFVASLISWTAFLYFGLVWLISRKKGGE